MNLPDIFNERILGLPVLLFSIVVHEYSHAYVAYRAGDDTAARLGRLTLNPVAHIDPIGTLLIPLIQFLSPVGLPLIGWAKPVPVNPLRFRSSEWDIFVSLAGPGSNLVLAVIAAVGLKMCVLAGLIHLTPLGLFVASHSSAVSPIVSVLLFFLTINIALAIFNLIPIPPLDGSHVIYRVLVSARSPLAELYERIAPYGYFILILILVTPASRFFGWIVQACENFIFRFIF